MPKIVDHSARRHDVVQAYWRVVRRDGIEAASVRGVAAEAGMTAGAMRHYFTDAGELRQAAMEAVMDRVVERVQRAASIDDALERAAAITAELIPLDEERQGEAEVWFAFAAAARFDATSRVLASEAYDRIRDLLAHVVVSLQPGLDPGDARIETERLFALVDGLVLHAVQRPDLADGALMQAVVDRHLADLAAS